MWQQLAGLGSRDPYSHFLYPPAQRLPHLRAAALPSLLVEGFVFTSPLHHTLA